MDDLENLSNSVERDVNNFFKKASSVDESPVIEGFDDFFEVTDLNPPGGVGGSSSGDNPNGDKTGGGSFAITVNGTAPTTGSDGLPVYASTVSLDCNPGHVILLVGGSANSNAIQSDGSGGNQIDHADSFSASFPVGNENAFFGVYGQVTYKTSLVNGVRVPSGEPTSGSIVINTSANVATSFKDEWSRASDFATNSDKPLVFMFPIGVVCLQKDGINRRVFVNQLQSGDKNINHSNEADGSINIGDGFREITFCINGDPFTGFVDFRGIKKV
jgi:hypothetical protein